MIKQEFREFIKDRIVYLDGGTGTNLAKAGMPGGVCTEKWVSENPEAMLALQRRYIEAGSDILYAPTFAANSTVTVERPEGKDWSNCYYKIVYNVTVSGSSNKFIEFTKAEFTGK